MPASRLAAAIRLTQQSNGGAPSVYGELCTVNETSTIRRQEDNGLGNFVRCTWTTRRRLGSQLLEGLAHCFGTFRARRSGTHGIDPHPARAIFGRPCLGEQINGGLARPIEAHA